MFHTPKPKLMDAALPLTPRGASAAEAQDSLAGLVPRAADAPPRLPAPQAARRPRIAIMGEFSAGKSTLSNLLMGAPALPTRVTATQLPPVWLSHGSGPSHGVALDGTRFDVDIDRLEAVDLRRTQYLSIQRRAEVLQVCDLIDFPGISDPSMPAEVWQRAVPLADAVIWCTHATQAWRQSEAAAWEEMPEELRARSILLLTRFDKISDPKDRRRVLSRVRRETDGMFAQVFPVSLTRAIAAGQDAAAFSESGAQAFLDALLDLVMVLSNDLGHAIPIAATSDALDDFDGPGADSNHVDSYDADSRYADPNDAGIVRLSPRPDPLQPVSTAPPASRIVPRRVRPVTGTARKARPPAPVGDDGPAFPSLA